MICSVILWYLVQSFQKSGLGDIFLILNISCICNGILQHIVFFTVMLYFWKNNKYLDIIKILTNSGMDKNSSVQLSVIKSILFLNQSIWTAWGKYMKFKNYTRLMVLQYLGKRWTSGCWTISQGHLKTWFSFDIFVVQ